MSNTHFSHPRLYYDIQTPLQIRKNLVFHKHT